MHCPSALQTRTRQIPTLLERARGTEHAEIALPHEAQFRIALLSNASNDRNPTPGVTCCSKPRDMGVGAAIITKAAGHPQVCSASVCGLGLPALYRNC